MHVADGLAYSFDHVELVHDDSRLGQDFLNCRPIGIGHIHTHHGNRFLGIQRFQDRLDRRLGPPFDDLQRGVAVQIVEAGGVALPFADREIVDAQDARRGRRLDLSQVILILGEGAPHRLGADLIGGSNLLHGLVGARLGKAFTQATGEATARIAGRVRFGEVARAGKAVEAATQHHQGDQSLAQGFIGFGTGTGVMPFHAPALAIGTVRSLTRRHHLNPDLVVLSRFLADHPHPSQPQRYADMILVHPPSLVGWV